MGRTIDFAVRMDPDAATFNFLLPLPGSETWGEIEKNGEFFFRLDDPDVAGFYGSRIRYRLPGMDPEEVSRFYKQAYRCFYLRPGKIFGLLRRSLHPGELGWLIETVLGVLGISLPAAFRYRLPAEHRIELKSSPAAVKIVRNRKHEEPA